MDARSHRDRYERLMEMMPALADAAPGAMKGFGTMHRAAVTDGALSGTTKELMALAIAIVVHCEGCIAFHVHDAIAAGASEAEFDETITVALSMGGGPAVVYAAEALRAYQEFVDVSAGS